MFGNYAKTYGTMIIRMRLPMVRPGSQAAIRRAAPDVKAVVLDDAFQHRKLKGGLNMVLTTWQKPWSTDALLPAGTLRDLPSRARAADAVIVTKCPALPRAETQAQWRLQLHLRNDQPLFFSGLRYEAPRSLHDPSQQVPTGKEASAFVLTGIADPEVFVAHVRSLFGTVEHLAFPDHHVFTASDQMRIAKRFVSFAGLQKTLITTEKDAARLGTALISGPMEDLPIAVIGVKAEILNEPHAFAALLRSHVATHPTHR